VGVDPRERAGGAGRRVNITLYKLWAFALASFTTGVAGCLLAAQVGVPRAITFQTQDSLTLAAAAMIGGIFSLWGAVLAGSSSSSSPSSSRRSGDQHELPADHLRRRPAAGAADRAGRARRAVPKDMANLGGSCCAAPLAPRAEGEGAVIEVSDSRSASRRHADRRHERRLPGGTCGLIGPNGAGKTTFFNVLSGFVKPAAGTITAFGEDLLKMADFRRARWGLRARSRPRWRSSSSRSTTTSR
jgi:hypothetical protein